MRLQILLGLGVISLAFFTPPKTVAGGEIPYTALVADQKECEKTFKGMASIKKSYCLCATIDIHNEFSLKQYLALGAEVLSKIDDSGSISSQQARSISRVREIAAACLKKISDQM